MMDDDDDEDYASGSRNRNRKKRSDDKSKRRRITKENETTTIEMTEKVGVATTTPIQILGAYQQAQLRREEAQRDFQEAKKEFEEKQLSLKIKQDELYRTRQEERIHSYDDLEPLKTLLNKYEHVHPNGDFRPDAEECTVLFVNSELSNGAEERMARERMKMLFDETVHYATRQESLCAVFRGTIIFTEAEEKIIKELNLHVVPMGRLYQLGDEFWMNFERPQFKKAKE